jgi:DICT domain-containing protein
MTDQKDDEVLDALNDVVRALSENSDRVAQALERARLVRAQRAGGKRYSEILEHAERPLLVELLSTNLTELQRVGHRLRSVEARALHNEGFTMDRIAELFGVSRQRVSALLRADRAASSPS